jgi:hypothetical protein
VTHHTSIGRCTPPAHMCDGDDDFIGVWKGCSWSGKSVDSGRGPPQSSDSAERRLRGPSPKHQALAASPMAGFLGKRVTEGIHIRASQMCVPRRITWPFLRAIIHLRWRSGRVWRTQPHYVIPLLEVKGGKTEGGSETAPARFPTTTCPSPTVGIWSASSQTNGVWQIKIT